MSVRAPRSGRTAQVEVRIAQVKRETRVSLNSGHASERILKIELIKEWSVFI